MEGILPEKIRERKTKLGFSTPESLWQRTTLNPLISQALDDPKLNMFINAARAKSHFAGLNQSLQKDFTPWRWLNLSLWMKSFNLDPSS